MKAAGTVLGLVLLMGLSFAFIGPGATASPAKSAKLEKIVNLGEHWYGEKLDLKDLKGRVVLYEFWGLN